MNGRDRIVHAIESLPEDWHGSGSLSGRVLRAIDRHCRARPPIAHSVETGAGKSTLLFSHLSAHHLVFAMDRGGSLGQVKASPLLNHESVQIVEGPTQKTLPRFAFGAPLHAALIDGPHAYPFPDLEYYYIYPHLAEGALLIVDDIDIPSIRRMVEILRKDAMFRLVETVERTAFFERTAAPLFDPLGDGWGRQGFNAGHKKHQERKRALARQLPWLRWLVRRARKTL